MKKMTLNKITGCLLFALLIFSCAAPTKKPVVKEVVPEEKAPVHILREKALDFEKTGEHYTALQLWKSLNHINPEDSEANQKIAELSTAIHEKADEQFKKGLAYYQHNSTRDARKAFLLALYHDPENQEALDYLKNKLQGDDYTLYETRQGDTFPSIAVQYYKDTGKDFLISYYNDLARDVELNPGTVLKLPALDLPASEEPARYQTKLSEKMPQEKVDPAQPPPEKPMIEMPTSPSENMQDLQIPSETSLPDVETPSQEITKEAQQMAAVTANYETETVKKNLLNKARKLFESKKYPESISLAENILEQDAENADATDLVNASYYQMGKATSDQKDYETAIKYYSLVDPGYKDVNQLKTGIEVKLAENHYLQGVKYFLKENIEKAIHEWEITVALNPDHNKAKLDMEQAKKILRRVKEIK